MSHSNVLTLKFENHKVPEFKEVKGKEWVYFGEDNQYPDYLTELFLRSAKHNAIINAKVNYVYGGGLTINEDNSSYTQRAVAKKFIENLEPFIRQTITDFEIFNGYALEVIWNKAGSKITEFGFIPLSKIRTNADETEYYYSNDWRPNVKQDPEKTGFKTFKPFDINEGGGSQLFVYKITSPVNSKNKNVYPVPEYIGATASIETDIEIANYHLNNIKTGFSVGTIINFNNGVPEADAQADIEKQIKKKFQGTDKAGSVAITFNNSTENAPTITSFAPSDLDKQFIEISKRVEQDIFTGHKITSPMLFGVKTEGQLGGRTEMIDAYELFQNTYVNIRQAMLEEVINQFAGLFGIVNRIYFKKANAVKSAIPESLITQAYTPAEIREVLGLPPLKQSQDEGTKSVIDAINTLSPLVANKVLESMTADEIRALVGLGKSNGQQPTLTTQMVEEKKNYKLEQDIYEVLFEREWTGQSDEDCISEFKKMKFASELSAQERAIVDLLSKDPLMPSDGIAKVIKSDVKTVNSLIDSLNARGFLNGIEGGFEPTTEATDIVEEDGAKTLNTEIKYKYGWRFDVKDRNVENSRDFCKKWLKKTEPQTGWLSREQIDELSNGQDLPVWDSRGGWWNKDGANLPFCRHQWIQMVVKRK